MVSARVDLTLHAVSKYIQSSQVVEQREGYSLLLLSFVS